MRWTSPSPSPVRRTSKTVLASAVLALLLPGSSVAAVLGAGQRPHTARGGNDSVHVVWSQNLSKGAAVLYCRVPGDSGTCEVTRQLPNPEGDPSGEDPPFVFYAGDLGLYVVQSRAPRGFFQVFVWVSRDNGNTFSAPRAVSNHRINRDAVFSRQDADGNATPTLFTVSELGENGVANVFQQIRILGPRDDRTALLDTQNGAHATVGLQGTTPFAVFDRNAAMDFTFLKPAAPGPPGRPNDASQWNLPAKALGSGQGVRLASAGSQPPYLLFNDEEFQPRVGRLTAGGFLGQPLILGEYGNGEQDIALGGLGVHVAWALEDEFGPDSLMYARAQLGEQDPFSDPVELTTASDLRNLSIQMGRRGGVAWNETFISVTNTPVRYIPFPSNVAAASRAGAQASQVPSGLAALKADAALGRGGTVASVLAGKGCAPRGRRYRVRAVIGDRPKSRPAQRTKVRRATFAIDRRRPATDRRGPFAANLSTAGLRRGSRHRVTVRVLARKGRSLRAVRTLRYGFRVCR